LTSAWLTTRRATPRQPELIQRFCEARGWAYIFNEERRGALYNLYQAAHVLEPELEDVIVFVDADDRLIKRDSLSRLRWYYEEYGPLLTYGSYVCDPPDDFVTPAMNFPDDIVRENAYRRWTARDDPDATWFNHLRTMRFHLFDRLRPERDFQFPDGRWFMACYDTATMVPALELAGGRHLMIPEVLYLYTRDNPLSDCRASLHEIEEAHRQIFGRPPLEPLGPVVTPIDLT
jgi:glycosyltransferase involved in cell wall biosynthesis